MSTSILNNTYAIFVDIRDLRNRISELTTEDSLELMMAWAKLTEAEHWIREYEERRDAMRNEEEI